MRRAILPAVYLTLMLTVVTGFIYPLIITGVAQLFFHEKANGSLVILKGVPIGSRLIGQSFSSDRYFWPRPSAVGYDPVPSGGSNFGPTSDTLKRLFESREKYFESKNGLPSGARVPPEMLFASGSGLDPDISPESAMLQVKRVAGARHLDSVETMNLRELVKRSVVDPELGVLGEPRVNVLELNLQIDSLR